MARFQFVLITVLPMKNKQCNDNRRSKLFINFETEITRGKRVKSATRSRCPESRFIINFGKLVLTSGRGNEGFPVDATLVVIINKRATNSLSLLIVYLTRTFYVSSSKKPIETMTQKQLPLSLKQALEATKVTYARLGQSGLRLSVPILGAMSFGHKDWQEWVVDDEAEVEKLLKGAWDVGLTSWDTANVYSNGVSEEMIGRAIQKFQIPRHKLQILTKCYGTVGEEPGVRHVQVGEEMKLTKDYINQGGLSRNAIFNAVNASLNRLQTDYIDLLQIHVRTV